MSTDLHDHAGVVASGVAWERDDRSAGVVQSSTIVTAWTWLAATCWHRTG